MIGLRIAAATRHLKQPFRKALHTATAAGLEGVQIDARDELRPVDMTVTAVRQVRKLLEETNLQVAGGTFPTRRGLLDVRDAERRLAALSEAMELIGRLGGRTIVTNLGPLPEPDGSSRSDALQILEVLATAGQRLGVTPAVAAAEAEARELLDLIAELHEGTIGVEFNPADLIRHGRSPREWLAQFGSHVTVMTANDAAPGLGGAGALEVELGRGIADVDELLVRLMDQYKYRGWVVVGRANSPRPADEMADAAAYVRACGS